MCNSPSEPTSWTTRLEPQSAGIHAPLESRRHPTRQIPGSQADSPLSVTPSPPSSQTHELFPLHLQDLFSKSDPFMEIYKTNGDQSDQLVWRTEVGAQGNGTEVGRFW